MGRGPESRDTGNPLESAFLPKLPSGRIINQVPSVYQGDRVIGVVQHFATDPTGKSLRLRRHLQCNFSAGPDTPTPSHAAIQWNFIPENSGGDQEDERESRFVEYTVTPAETKIAVFHPFQQGQAKIASFHVQEGKLLRAFLYPQPKQYKDVPEFESDEEAVQFLRQKLLDVLSNPKHTSESLKAAEPGLTFMGDLSPDVPDSANMIVAITSLVQKALPKDSQKQEATLSLLEGLHAAQHAYSLLAFTNPAGQPSVRFLVRTISRMLNRYQEELPKNILRCDFTTDLDKILVATIPLGANFFYEEDPDLESLPVQEIQYDGNNVFPLSEDDPNGYGYIFTKEDNRVRMMLVKGAHAIQQYSIVTPMPDQRKLTKIGLAINSDYGEIPETVAPIRFESPQGDLDTAPPAVAA